MSNRAKILSKWQKDHHKILARNDHVTEMNLFVSCFIHSIAIVCFDIENLNAPCAELLRRALLLCFSLRRLSIRNLSEKILSHKSQKYIGFCEVTMSCSKTCLKNENAWKKLSIGIEVKSVELCNVSLDFPVFSYKS